jgi:hypothetical protein
MHKFSDLASQVRSWAGSLAIATVMALLVAWTPLAALAQSATVSASPSSFTTVGQQITFTYTILPGSYSITSISGTSQIKGVPITCQAPNDNNPFTCTSVYTVDALDDMSGTFSDFAVFTGNRVGGTFNITSPTLAVPKSGGGPVSISVSSAPNPTQPGETVTVQATISSMGCNSGLMPPGSLQVTVGSISQSLPLVAEFPYSTGDTVSFTTTALPAGSHAVSASYAGGAGCAAGSATGTNHVVEPRPTATVTANAQSGSSQSFNISFSAPVTGLTAGEITIASNAGAVTRSLTGSGTSYVLTLTGMTQSGTISVTVPASVAQTTAGSQNLSSGSAVVANYLAQPVVSSVSPNFGPVAGGTTVTITGTALTGATAVTFGGQPATGVTVNSATSITATTPASVPAGTPGPVSVLVTTPGGTNVANALFTYRADQTISFTDPADIASFVANQTVGLTATATSGLTVTFASTTPAVCSVTGATVTVLAGGTCTINANQAGNSNYNAAPEVSQSFVISPADQSISFTDPADIASFVPNQSVALTATATSGLTVAFASTTPAICSVSGATATVLSAGTCTVTANQAGNGSYNPAPEVSQSFDIDPADQTISFTDPADIASFVPNQSVDLTATATSGLTVAFASTTPAVCSVTGATATVLAVGTCTVTANQAGNASYNPAPEVSQSFDISPADQSISFTDPADIASFVPNQTVGLTATATSGLTVSFASTTPAICSVSGATATVLAAGTCSITANQAGNSNYNPAPEVSQSFEISPGDQSISFTDPADIASFVPNQTVGLTATATSGLTVAFATTTPAVCSVTGATATVLAGGTCTVTANQAGDSNYNPAPEVSQSFVISPADQSISFTDPADIGSFVPNQTVGLTATATSGLTVSFASTTPAICSVSGTTATVLAGGTCTIAANQAGNGSYNPAPEVSQSFDIDPANQSISFADPADIGSFVPNQTVGLSATATSGLTVSFASTTPGVCSVTGATATVLAGGTCTITANQAGNGSYSPAPEVSQSFVISPADQSISFTDPADIASFVPNQSVGLTATATSGLTVAFASTTPAICSVSGATATVLSAGTCTITANQAGNGSYNPAPEVIQSFDIDPADQSISFTDPADIASFVPNQAVGLTATATSGLTVAFASTTPAICSVSGATATVLAVGTCTVIANQAGNASYNPAPEVSQSFDISPADQAITFTSVVPSPAYVDGATYAVSANGGLSTSPVVFSISAGSAGFCTIAGNVVSFIGEGSCVVLANQAGDANYNPAPQVSQTILVERQVQVITFTSTAPTNAVVGGQTYLVSANGGGSGSAVVFSIDGTASGICSISGNTVSFIGDGTCTVNANQAGNAAYQDAPEVQQSFAVAANTAPTADAGPDQTDVTPGSTVTLDGTGSVDPDVGQTLGYAWLQTAGPSVTLSDATAVQPSFTAPLLNTGVNSETLEFQLTVDDGNGGTTSDTVSIIVVDNIAPTVVISGLPSEVTSGGSFTVTFTFNEPVTGFDASDVAVTNGTLTGFSGSDAVYTATITASGAGDVGLSIAAGAADDLAGNPSVASGVFSVPLTATAETEELLADEALARNRALIASQPDLTRFLSGGRGGITVSSQGAGGLTFDIETSPDKTLWLALNGRWGSGDAALDRYVHGAVGAHLFRNEGLIFGAMLQADHGEHTDGLGRVETDGWLVGPYFVARFGDGDLLMSGSFLAGKTDIAVNPIGTYTDFVTSDRRLITFSLVDEIQMDQLLLRPRLDIAKVVEDRPGYTDGLGNPIAAGKVAITEASAGVDFETPLAVAFGTARLSGGLSAIHALEEVDGVSDRSTRGRIDIGLMRDFGNGANLDFSASYDGIGSSERGSFGLELQYSYKF